MNSYACFCVHLSPAVCPLCSCSSYSHKSLEWDSRENSRCHPSCCCALLRHLPHSHSLHLPAPGSVSTFSMHVGLRQRWCSNAVHIDGCRIHEIHFPASRKAAAAYYHALDRCRSIKIDHPDLVYSGPGCGSKSVSMICSNSKALRR